MITIAGNWKMNMNKTQLTQFFTTLSELLPKDKNPDIQKIICPTFPLLTLAKQKAKSLGIHIGAQNVYQKSSGAFTGEVSADILSSIGIKYCIIGHSERRQYQKETDKQISIKWEELRKYNIIPIICVGETLEERENNKTTEVIKTQLKKIFANQKLETRQKFIVAYEPVWAIGTGKTATPQQAQEVHYLIRKVLADYLGINRISKTPILYGGSVKSSNIKELMEQEDINGALVGGASMDPKEFAEIVKIAAKS